MAGRKARGRKRQRMMNRLGVRDKKPYWQESKRHEAWTKEAPSSLGFHGSNLSAGLIYGVLWSVFSCHQ